MFVFSPQDMEFPEDMNIGGFVESILNKDTYLDKCLMIEVADRKKLFYREDIANFIGYCKDEDEVWIKPEFCNEPEEIKKLKQLLNQKLEEWISHLTKVEPKANFRYVTVPSIDLHRYKWELIEKTPSKELRELLSKNNVDPNKLITAMEEVVTGIDKVLLERE